MPDHEIPDPEFDAHWQTRYETLGGRGLSDAEKILYPESMLPGRHLFLRHVIADLAERVSGRAGQAPLCLDIGCNAGLQTHLIHAHGMTALGVDYSPTLIAEARATYVGLSFLQADAYALPFAAGQFDAAVSFGVLPCLSDWKTSVIEMLRILRAGGVGAIETNRAHSVPESLSHAVRTLARSLVRGRVPVQAIWRHHRRHRATEHPHPDDRRIARCHRVAGIVAFLEARGADILTIHDPERTLRGPNLQSVAVTFRTAERDQARTRRSGLVTIDSSSRW